MKNPFRYGVPVTGEFYLPRPDMSRQLLKYATAGQKVLLYGRRRFGKTSFLKEHISTLKDNNITGVYVDLYPITSQRDFLLALTSGIKGSRLLSFSERVKTIIGDLFRLRPRLVVEDDGLALDFIVPSLREDDIKSAIEDTIRLLGKLNEGSPLAVIFDEFQKIAEIDDDGWLEGTLRSEIQNQSAVSYIFCGSRRGLILDMFQNSQRPFYQMCTAIELPRMDDSFAKWLEERLELAGLKLNTETAITMLDRVDWSPNYAQMIAFHLVADPPSGEITVADIDRVLDNLSQLNGYTYMTLFESLSANAQRTLRLIAINPGQSPFRQELMTAFGLTSSGVQSAIRSLVNKHLLDDTTSGGNIVFDDPLFLRWIQKTFSY